MSRMKRDSSYSSLPNRDVDDEICDCTHDNNGISPTSDLSQSVSIADAIDRPIVFVKSHNDRCRYLNLSNVYRNVFIFNCLNKKIVRFPHDHCFESSRDLYVNMITFTHLIWILGRNIWVSLIVFSGGRLVIILCNVGFYRKMERRMWCGRTSLFDILDIFGTWEIRWLIRDGGG